LTKKKSTFEKTLSSSQPTSGSVKIGGIQRRMALSPQRSDTNPTNQPPVGKSQSDELVSEPTGDNNEVESEDSQSGNEEQDTHTPRDVQESTQPLVKED